MLGQSYMRRKQWEARVLAATIGEMLVGSGGKAPGRAGAGGGSRVSADTMLAELGVRL